MSKTMAAQPVKKDNVASDLSLALEAGRGLLRLTPTWVPRSFLHPGKRIKLAPTDWYAYGAHRGGIDERWFASTTIAANENRTPDEGLSYVTFEGRRYTLRDAVAESGARLIGKTMFDQYKRWPVYSKFFDNMGPIPHHMHQSFADAALVGQEGKPESYYFPPQLNNVDNNFAYTFMGVEPGTTKAQLRKCLEDWHQGDNGILDLSRAYRLKRGTGWLIPPGVLHAPGSLCTYEPQWGSDVFAMFQSLVEGREVPWSLLVKDVPAEKHQDLDFIVGQLDWEKNVDPLFKEHHYLEPIADQDASGLGYTDRWIVYGTVDGRQLFQRQGIDRSPGRPLHDHRSWRQRLDHGARLRQDGPLGIADAGDDSLWRRDGRRSVHQPRGGNRRRGNRKYGKRTAGRPAVLRPRCPFQAAGRWQLSPLRPESMSPANSLPKLHNAAWPGVVGKGPDSEPPIDLDTMLDLTAAAEVDGVKFDGVDLFLFAPHVNIDASDAELDALADKVRQRSLVIGSVVAPVWPPTGGGSAMGSDEDRQRFLEQVGKGCHIANKLRELGVRPYGVVRIDSACGVHDWLSDPAGNQKRIADTFRQAADIAADHGEQLAAEGEICWGGMHSWRRMVELLEMVDRRNVLGFQADMAHTLLYLLGYNAPEDALLPANFDWRNKAALDEALAKLTAALRPWTIDFHVAQNDATVFGTGSHDKTGRHCLPDDPKGKLDIPHHAGFWMRDEAGRTTRRFEHICWDGCMFPNATMHKPETWNKILAAMVSVRKAHGWN